MSKFFVIWEQEMEDGRLATLDTTFDSMDDVERHIRYLEEDAHTLNKPFKLLSVTDLTNKKIKPNKAHLGRKMKGKGSGWRNESRRHSLARIGIRTNRM